MRYTSFIAALILAPCIDASAATTSKGEVKFTYPDGRYTSRMLANDFGNGAYYKERDYAFVEDGAYKIVYNKGQKVNKTGASTTVDVEPGRKYTIEYKIKYSKDFEDGLHGKQLGFILGAGYSGGHGDNARNNGDGGSVRIQFDAKKDVVANQLYVYYSDMLGRYGNNPGGQSYTMPKGVWNNIKMTVTLESAYGACDGRVEIWCNGKKGLDVQGMNFVRKDEGRKITKLSLEAFPGGGGIVPTFDNTLFVDDFKWYKED